MKDGNGMGCFGVFFAFLGVVMLILLYPLRIADWFPYVAPEATEIAWGYIAIGVFLYVIEWADVAYRKWKRNK